MPGQAVPPEIDDGDTDPEGPAPRTGASLAPLVVLLLYVVGATVVVYVAYHSSNEYKIEKAVAAGDRILGNDQGRSADLQHLEVAAHHYLDALVLDPDLAWAHHQMKSIRWRFQEHDVPFPTQLDRLDEAIAARAHHAHKGTFLDALPITPEDRYGGAAKRLAHYVRWAVIFGAIILLWSIYSFVQNRRARRRRPATVEDKGTAMY